MTGPLTSGIAGVGVFGLCNAECTFCSSQPELANGFKLRETDPYIVRTPWVGRWGCPSWHWPSRPGPSISPPALAIPTV